MNIIETANQTICACNSRPDIIDTIISLLTFFLGVITIIAGRYILQIRKEAKYGFYINLLIYIKRLRPFFLEGVFCGITDYMCDEENRNYDSNLLMPKDRKELLLPGFLSICNQFSDFISKAENNISPRKNIFRVKENRMIRQKWYNNIIILIQFIQKCQLMGENMVAFTAANEYTKELKEFNKALKEIETCLHDELGIKNLNLDPQNDISHE